MRIYKIPEENLEEAKAALIERLISSLLIGIKKPYSRSKEICMIPNNLPNFLYGGMKLYDIKGQFYIIRIKEDQNHPIKYYILERNKNSKTLKNFISQLEKIAKREL